MTGRELFIYILENSLELDDEVEYIFSKIFMTEEEAASKFEVGVETIRAWYKLKLLPGIEIGDTVVYLTNVADPRKRQ